MQTVSFRKCKAFRKNKSASFIGTFFFRQFGRSNFHISSVARNPPSLWHSTLAIGRWQDRNWCPLMILILSMEEIRQAPVEMMVNIPLSIGFHTCQVVQDFFHQQYYTIVIVYQWKKQDFHCGSIIRSVCLRLDIDVSTTDHWISRKFIFTSPKTKCTLNLQIKKMMLFNCWSPIN